MADPDSTTGKAPAFQFYPKDFLSDSHVVAMRLPERGAYITLLCLCWLDGSIPSDLELLARRCQVSTTAFTRLWPALEPCFRVCSTAPSRLVQPRIERERQKQVTWREMKAKAGRKGGTAKAEGKQTPSRRLAKASPPFSSSSPSSSSSPISDLRSAEGQEISPEPQAALVPVEAPVLVYPTVGLDGRQWGLTATQIAEWRIAFPGLDVLGEARKASAWLEANPSKRKTVKGMPRFLVAWLTRATDSGRGGGPAGIVVGSLKTAGNAAAMARFIARGQA